MMLWKTRRLPGEGITDAVAHEVAASGERGSLMMLWHSWLLGERGSLML